MADAFTDILTKIRSGELPRNNLTVNAVLSDYLAAAKGRRKAKVNAQVAEAKDITPYEQAMASGDMTPDQSEALYIGSQLGLTNPPANPIRALGGNSYSAAPRASFVPQKPGTPYTPQPEVGMTLRDFVANPALVNMGRETLKRQQELQDYETKQIISNNLATKKATDVITFKNEISNNKGAVVPWEKLTLNQKMRFAQIYKGVDLSGTTPDEATLKKAYMSSFGGDIPANQVEQSQENDLSPEANEVLEARKKRKK